MVTQAQPRGGGPGQEGWPGFWMLSCKPPLWNTGGPLPLFPCPDCFWRFALGPAKVQPF